MSLDTIRKAMPLACPGSPHIFGTKGWQVCIRKGCQAKSKSIAAIMSAVALRSTHKMTLHLYSNRQTSPNSTQLEQNSFGTELEQQVQSTRPKQHIQVHFLALREYIEEGKRCPQGTQPRLVNMTLDNNTRHLAQTAAQIIRKDMLGEQKLFMLLSSQVSSRCYATTSVDFSLHATRGNLH